MDVFSAEEAQQLFHNKFVAILGDSIQRSVYKDLVLLLQKDIYLSNSQLKSKGELSFEHDFLVEGGRLGELNNGTKYREVRQYRTDHHLVRFYFLTRVYSDYLESILADFKAGPQPDVLIINSCVWDVSRYGPHSMEDYKVNLEKMFTRIDEVVLPECLVVWNMAMPLAHKITGGFLIPELQHLDKTLRRDIIEGNFYSATLAASNKFDVLDLHYHFRFDSHNRLKDGVHWNQIVHRKITHLLLTHIADAWGVEVPKRKANPDSYWTESIDDALRWFEEGFPDPSSGSSVVYGDQDDRRNPQPPLLHFTFSRSDDTHRSKIRKRQYSVEEPDGYVAPYRGLEYDNNSEYISPKRPMIECTYQQTQTVKHKFTSCGPPPSYCADNLEPYFYDDSPGFHSNYSPGYTPFDDRPVYNGSNGSLRRFEDMNHMSNYRTYADVPMHNFGYFPHHSDYPLRERRQVNDNFVMRRPLKSREVLAPYYRPRDYRCHRY
ncbi:PC-esterase domain-containing protein 1A-like [Pleurodeles waltl]|uniref:PC-esterase domain-containing protein 1A-like n=1 Tax=Pleurodeles waltl TaxID=8319 RepID=UPI003709787C